MTDQLLSALNRFSNDLLDRIAAKYSESNAEVLHAVVNLRRDRDLLLGLINNTTIQQYPMRFQEELLARIVAVNSILPSDAESALADEAGFSKTVEDLHYFVWTHELEHRGQGFVGYEAKLNHLKDIEQTTDATRSELVANIEILAKVRELLELAQTHSENASKSAESADSASEASKESKERIESTLDSASESLKAIETHFERADSLLTKIEAARKDSEQNQTLLKSYYDEMDANRLLITNAIEDLRRFSAVSKLTQKELTDEFEKQRAKVDELLAGAVSGGLFHAFEDRVKKLSAERAKTLKFLTVSAVIVLLVGGTILLEINGDTKISDLSWQVFALRLFLAGPFVYGIAFFSMQYNKERRLEEEYAFKSNVSLSLEPFRNLVKSMVEQTEKTEREQYIKFVTDSVSRVFTPPAFSSKEAEDGDFGAGEKAIKTLEKLGKSLKPFLNVFKR